MTEFQENDNSFPTIGDFYDYVLSTFKRLNPTLQTDKQIDLVDFFTKENIPKDTFKSTILGNLQDVESAIQIIKKQGEGSRISPADDGEKLKDLAHYYRFAEIYKGKKLILELKFGDEDIAFPDVFPMSKVPPGGYQKDQVPKHVAELLDKFDRNFTDMMNELQKAWTEDKTALGTAVGIMFSLGETAQQLMNIPILADGSTGNFGPCFRYLGST